MLYYKNSEDYSHRNTYSAFCRSRPLPWRPHWRSWQLFWRFSYWEAAAAEVCVAVCSAEKRQPVHHKDLKSDGLWIKRVVFKPGWPDAKFYCFCYGTLYFRCDQCLLCLSCTYRWCSFQFVSFVALSIIIVFRCCLCAGAELPLLNLCLAGCKPLLLLSDVHAPVALLVKYCGVVLCPIPLHWLVLQPFDYFSFVLGSVQGRGLSLPYQHQVV